MARQLQIQEAVLAQFNPANVLSKFQEIAAAGSQVVKTDVPQSMLGYFVDLAGKTKELPIIDVALVPDNGVDPEDPDYEYIRQLVQQALPRRRAGRGLSRAVEGPAAPPVGSEVGVQLPDALRRRRAS